MGLAKGLQAARPVASSAGSGRLARPPSPSTAMPPVKQDPGHSQQQAGPRDQMVQIKAAIESLGQELKAAGGLRNEEVR